MQKIKKHPFTPTAIISAVLLFVAIQQHLITDIFVISLSLIFDKFSVKSSGLLPDIILTICFVLLAMGSLHAVKNHKTAVIFSALFATGFLVWSV